MQPSDNAIQVITHFESFFARAYKDPVGIWTIGYGTIRVNGKPVAEGMTCTMQQAREWMMEELETITPAIEKVCTVALTQSQLDALASFVYNLGIGNFSKSSLLRTINAKEPVVEDLFTRWNKATVNGVLTPLPGLTRRRKSEFHLFSTGNVKLYF